MMKDTHIYDLIDPEQNGKQTENAKAWLDVLKDRW